MNDILVMAEHRGGQLLPVTYEMLALAADLAESRGGKVSLAVLADDPREMAETAARTAGVEVLAVQGEHLKVYNPEVFLAAVTKMLGDLSLAFLLAAHTTTGMDYTPALAVRLRSALVTGVEGVSRTEDGCLFTRAMFGGKIEAQLASQTDLTILTVMPGAFKPKPYDGPGGTVLQRSISIRPERVKVLNISEGRSDDAALSEADVIVAVGRGLGKPDNLGMVRQLADQFPRSALAGSRPVCDQGWLEYKHQVGQTGATVTPKLYLAFGISGARQHTMGMQGSGFIVAVSIDPYAAIFNLADVCIVEDLTEFIPALLESRQEGDQRQDPPRTVNGNQNE